MGAVQTTFIQVYKHSAHGLLHCWLRKMLISNLPMVRATRYNTSVTNTKILFAKVCFGGSLVNCFLDSLSIKTLMHCDETLQ